MNNILMRQIVVGEDYQSLASQQTVVTVTVSAPPTNLGNVVFKGDDGGEVPWVPGEWHTFQSVDLAQIEVKGLAGDKVTVVGGTW
jgi:hypothetical protein